MSLFCFIFYQVTAINSEMVINNKASRMQKFAIQIKFFPLKFNVAGFFSLSMIYANIHLRKARDNICYFHEKQP